MSAGQSQLYSLLADATITALLTEGEDGIFYDTVLPNYYTDGSELQTSDSTILYYRVSPINGGLDYLDTDYSVNCRAATQSEAEDLAEAVKAIVNRNFTIEGYGFRASILPTIAPLDSTDNYNTPLDVKVWGRSKD